MGGIHDAHRSLSITLFLFASPSVNFALCSMALFLMEGLWSQYQYLANIGVVIEMIRYALLHHLSTNLTLLALLAWREPDVVRF